MRSGGSFAQSIGDAWLYADSHNQPRVYEAFHDLFEKFAPTKKQGVDMKTFEVEFRRTSFIQITVTAKDMGEAEFIAWQEIPETKGADWQVECVAEVE